VSELKAAGADDFMHKPFEVERLVERMCQHLDIEMAASAVKPLAVSHAWKKGRRLSPTSWRGWRNLRPTPADARRREARIAGRVCRGAGHEINNPLTVISGRAQLLLREETDPERQHALALISGPGDAGLRDDRRHDALCRPPRPDLQIGRTDRAGGRLGGRFPAPLCSARDGDPPQRPARPHC